MGGSAVPAHPCAAAVEAHRALRSATARCTLDPALAGDPPKAPQVGVARPSDTARLSVPTTLLAGAGETLEVSRARETWAALLSFATAPLTPGDRPSLAECSSIAGLALAAELTGSTAGLARFVTAHPLWTCSTIEEPVAADSAVIADVLGARVSIVAVLAEVTCCPTYACAVALLAGRSVPAPVAEFPSVAGASGVPSTVPESVGAGTLDALVVVAGVAVVAVLVLVTLSVAVAITVSVAISVAITVAVAISIRMSAVAVPVPGAVTKANLTP